MAGEITQKTSLAPINPLTDVIHAQHTFQEAENELPYLDLDHLLPFNGVYANMTDDVGSHTYQPGYYDMPDVVTENIPHFAGYYFDAINAVRSSKTVPAMWAIPMLGEKMRQSHPAIQLAVGVATHIQGDLGLSVYTKSGFVPAYEADYKKVNDSVARVTDEVLDDYVRLRGRARRLTVRGIAKLVDIKRQYSWMVTEHLAAADNYDEETADAIKAAIASDVLKRTRATQFCLLKYGDLALKALATV